jgi:rhodanese-related sulfurtransferase
MAAPRRTIDEVLAAARARIHPLSPAEAAREVAGGARLVDIRSELQRARDGLVPGAYFHPRNVLEWRLDPASGHADPALADPEARVILLCHEGYASSLAAVMLQDLGFTRATDVAGGFEAWRAAGLPVEAP